jgi:hypothetical protein
MTGEPPRVYPDTATRPGAGPVPQVFEYALIRVVPRVERGESINAGVIVYAKNYRFLKSKIQLDEARLRALDPGADIAAARAALTAFERACSEGPLADQPLGERFRWLTAPRSAMVQPGPVHAGITTDPEADLTRLYDTLVSTANG